MKPNPSLLLAMLTIATIVVTSISYQHVLAPRDCGGCAEFKKLTTEFEKAVIASSDNPDEISRLIDEYSANVKALFANAAPSP